MNKDFNLSIKKLNILIEYVNKCEIDENELYEKNYQHRLPVRLPVDGMRLPRHRAGERCQVGRDHLRAARPSGPLGGDLLSEHVRHGEHLFQFFPYRCG